MNAIAEPMKLGSISLLLMSACTAPAQAADFLLAAHSSAGFAVSHPEEVLPFTAQTQAGGASQGGFYAQYQFNFIFNYCDDPRYSDGQNCGDSWVDTAIGDETYFWATPTLHFYAASAPATGVGFDGWIDFTNNSDAEILIGLPDNVTVPPAPSPTPEPAAWMMMLAGFALVGGAMRSRKRMVVSFG